MSLIPPDEDKIILWAIVMVALICLIAFLLWSLANAAPRLFVSPAPQCSSFNPCVNRHIFQRFMFYRTF
jgi:uncharacterized membrane protein YvbJ